MEAADQVFPDAQPLFLGQAVDGIRVVSRDVFLIDDPAHVLIGEPGGGVVVPLLAGEHPGNRLVRIHRLQQFQRDGLVDNGVLPLFALPFLAGQAAHVVIEAAGRAVVVLHHLEILETAPQQHPVAVHSELVREVGPPGQVAGDLRAGGDGRRERVFPEILPEQMVGRAMGIAERRGALRVVQTVPEHVTERCQDVVVPIQRKQEISCVKERPHAVMPVPMVFGHSHLEPLTKKNHPSLLGKGYAVQVGGHDGVRPQFHPAGIALQRKNVGNVPDVLVVPEEDLVVTGNTEMVQSFHSRFRFDPKIRILCVFQSIA